MLQSGAASQGTACASATHAQRTGLGPLVTLCRAGGSGDPGEAQGRADGDAGAPQPQQRAEAVGGDAGAGAQRHGPHPARPPPRPRCHARLLPGACSPGLGPSALCLHGHPRRSACQRSTETVVTEIEWTMSEQPVSTSIERRVQTQQESQGFTIAGENLSLCSHPYQRQQGV